MTILLYCNKQVVFIILDCTTSSDKLLLTTSVDVLSSQDMLTYDEVVDICLAADNQAKIKLLDDKLTAVSPSVYIRTLVFVVIFICHLESIQSTTATNAVDKIVPFECELPQSIKFSAGSSMRTCYTIYIYIYIKKLKIQKVSRD